MKARHSLVMVAAAMMAADVGALTTPSDSDGPIKLLGCIVGPTGVLEAQVDSQADDAMFCNIRCTYELGGKMFNHTFSETIPKRFQGLIGRFDTNNARPGNFPGAVGSCKKVSS